VSIPQANPSVQTISDLPDRKGNGNQPFAFPSPSFLVTNSQAGGIWLFQETI